MLHRRCLDFQQHERTLRTRECHLDEDFSRFRKAKLKLNPSKCEFGVNGIAFIGDVLSCNGLAPQPSKIAAVEELPPPKTVEAFKSLIGTFSFYKRYVKEFAIITSPSSNCCAMMLLLYGMMSVNSHLTSCWKQYALHRF